MAEEETSRDTPFYVAGLLGADQRKPPCFVEWIVWWKLFLGRRDRLWLVLCLMAVLKILEYPDSWSAWNALRL